MGFYHRSDSCRTRWAFIPAWMGYLGAGDPWCDLGLLNIAAEETRGFLLASIALTLSATALNTLPVLGTALSLVLPFVVAFVAGGMIVVALKELFQTARK